jgi:hypothetical protein
MKPESFVQSLVHNDLFWVGLWVAGGLGWYAISRRKMPKPLFEVDLSAGLDPLMGSGLRRWFFPRKVARATGLYVQALREMCVQDYRDALRYCERALSTASTHPEAQVLLHRIALLRGQALLGLKDWDGAILELERSLELFPPGGDTGYRVLAFVGLYRAQFCRSRLVLALRWGNS